MLRGFQTKRWKRHSRPRARKDTAVTKKRLRTDETTQWTRSRSISEIRAALLEAVLNYVSTATGPDLKELASRLPLCDEKIEATYERK
jgi:hypothetical protein